ncbi:uncharacterized protein LOC112590836 [Melanaphis sacchari]|uniref:uncharacterized protein LOC112590836 n=1 Tax=Melanaphis sacchari TaxID=742174 RepID=UPI000DC153AE|nr:uncharacterized protein LOC112590836 [Melanaphis sacchari]
MAVSRETDDVGRVYEVDITYPQNLHDVHNDMPFLPHSGIPKNSSVQKLLATFEHKERYVVHYLNLKQAIANGLIVDKVHRVLEFRQSPWLAPYTTLNTEMRQRATNKFEEQFFKDMVNSVFGKTMESMRKRIKMELVSCPIRMQKLINRPTFKLCTTYSENLAAVSMHNKVIDFCKPIYIGFSVLELSKTVMYDYHYNVMKRHYGDKISLLYTDTDSLLYHVTTEDFYDDLANKPNLLSRMDTSNLPTNHRCFSSARKRIPGLFKDETKGRTMYEFVALRAKSYAYDIERTVEIRAKGIRAHVLRNHLTFEDHKRCLFEHDDEGDTTGDEEDLNVENVSIRSFKHRVKTIKTMKLALNRSDDKRHVLSDNVHTLAHGHYKIIN